MCKVSDKLKLCTCKIKNVYQLKHYWILYKYQKSNEHLVGESVLPQQFKIGIENDEYNANQLATLLNDGNCFDIDLTINHKDILELNFTCDLHTATKESLHLVYEFVYKKRKWIINDPDPFNTDKLHKNQGKIFNPFN